MDLGASPGCVAVAKETPAVVMVMVCVSEPDDCGRHVCLVVRSTKQERCFVQPVGCWRCLERTRGITSPGVVKPEEVSSRFSTILSSIQTSFGSELSYPAGYTASEFAAVSPDGWARLAGASREVVVGAVEVLTPMVVLQQRWVTLPPLELGAMSDDGMFLPDGAPRDFVGPGSASDCLTWVRRAQEVGEWTTQLDELISSAGKLLIPRAGSSARVAEAEEKKKQLLVELVNELATFEKQDSLD
jgi:hypothetical protein